jgi:signal transduction histidine kinase
VLIHVHDTGIGISAQDVERIWEAFWQVHQTHAHRAQGTGLGLSVSRHLTTLLSADITVESEPGQGSTFTLRIPGSASVTSAEVLRSEAASTRKAERSTSSGAWAEHDEVA